jgi:GTP-binding protein
MQPTIVLVGRPNVGKSTLFNRLTRSRAAIVADVPGLTRDRHYGHARHGDRGYIVVDTGGLEADPRESLMREMARQTRQAIDEADAVLFLVDGRAGVTPQDREIALQLRRSGRRVHLVVNKAEGIAHAAAAADFFELGLGEPMPVSAAHGDGVRELMDRVLAPFPAMADVETARDHPAIAVVGRPNVGKSTLVNALVGEERVIAFDQPGTTRDSIHIEFDRNDRRYTLIDTAGVRRRAKVDDAIEKFSVVKTLQAIEDANVVILVLDATQEIGEQDAHIAGFILEAGAALVVAMNKWDATDRAQHERIRRDYERRLGFLEFAQVQYVSAVSGQGLAGLMRAVDAAYAAANARLPTPRLTRVLQAAIEKQGPPRAGLVRPKLRYAHQGGSNPPKIVIHGSALDRLPEAYRRYLERSFREAFRLRGTPVKVMFKKGKNPFSQGS